MNYFVKAILATNVSGWLIAGEGFKVDWQRDVPPVETHRFWLSVDYDSDSN